VIRAGVVAALALALAASASAAPLPAPALTVTGRLQALTAAGRYAVVATQTPTGTCVVSVADLVRGGRARQLSGPQVCQTGGGDAVVADLWLGKKTILAEAIDSPSPHGDSYTLWTAPLAGGPFAQYGTSWGWSDSDGDGPSGQGSLGCATTIGAGGGTIALASGPNLLGTHEVGGPGVDSCLPSSNGATTDVHYLDGALPDATVPGAWSVVATDGSSVLLAALQGDGMPTGQLSLRTLDGAPTSIPAVPAGLVAKAIRTWLAPEGLVLQSVNRVSAWPAHGAHWTVGNAEDAAVAEGRVAYLKGRVLHVRRIADGADRQLFVLPAGSDGLVGAGSFGIVVATGHKGNTVLYRVPWRTVDRVLPA
jgi:hypothetical protein